MTTFVGVSDEPGRGILPAGGLYEFWTDTGVRVYLHDTTLVGLDYRTSPSPSLTTTFVYDDPEWTPPEAVATPIVQFRFEGVHDLRVESDPVADRSAEQPHLVSLFDHWSPDGFDLQTYALRVVFAADLVRVSLSAD